MRGEASDVKEESNEGSTVSIGPVYGSNAVKNKNTCSSIYTLHFFVSFRLNSLINYIFDHWYTTERGDSYHQGIALFDPLLSHPVRNTKQFP